MHHVNPNTDHAFKMLERALNSETRMRGMQTGMLYVRIREADAQRIKAVARNNHDRIVALEEHARSLAAHIENLRASVSLAKDAKTPEEALELIKEQMDRVPPQM